MHVEREITDDDLDTRYPDPDDDGDDDSNCWAVHTMVMAADGTRHGCTVQQDDDMSAAQVAEAIARCAHAAAAMHSPAAAAALGRWLTRPEET